MDFPIRHPDFTTVTCLDWKPLLLEDKYKDLIIDSFRYLVRERRAVFYGFVIMETHFHIIWQMVPPPWLVFRGDRAELVD